MLRARISVSCRTRRAVCLSTPGRSTVTKAQQNHPLSVTWTRGRHVRRPLGVVSIVLGSLLLLPASALAAAPANDDVTAATVIAALPFTDTVDTSEATAAAGDL